MKMHPAQRIAAAPQLAAQCAALLLAGCGEQPPPPQPTSPPAPKPEPAAGITPMDIPAGYDYPGDRDLFQGWADNWEIEKITSAAWNLWAGMTSDSGQTWNGDKLPIWETWCGTEEAFAAGGCNKNRTGAARNFEITAQLAHTALRIGKPVPADTQVVSFNKFNPPMADFLAARHAGPGPAGTTYDYTSMQSLANLNAAWPEGTPIADRQIVDTPYQPDAGGKQGFSAIETKPVIFAVKAEGLTPMPLWQGPAGAKPGSQNNAVPESWLTCVLLDPANPAGPDTAPVAATPEQVAKMVPNPSLSCQTYLYAPLSVIYHFKMDKAEADAWNAVQGQAGVQAEAGDYGVLAAMHVNSKTILNWTWQTFWWQPGADTPNAFPGSKQGMTEKVQGTWRNYAMCTAWNQTQGNASSNMVVCFNPYLETSTGIPAGQTSNCMSCHGTATAGAPAIQPGSTPPNQITTLSYPPDYTKPIDFKNDPRYANYTRTDFSWAIPGNARVDLPQPLQPPAPPAAPAASAAPAAPSGN
jgi:hypothetical protein